MTFDFSFVLVGLMQIFGFFIQGTTGFGCTVIAAPVVMGILGPTEGVPYGTIIVLPFLYILGIKMIKHVSWKDLIRIVVLCVPGMLVGNHLYTVMNPSAAKISIGAMICIIALMNIYKHIIKPLVLKKVDDEDAPDTMGKRIFRYACLIVGGVVHGAFNIGGPLITVYTLEAVKDKAKFRNTMTWLWIVLNSMNAVNQYRSGALTPHFWSALLVGLPMAAIGFFFGVRFLEKINRVTFLRIVYIVLLFIGANMLIRNVLAVL